MHLSKAIAVLHAARYKGLTLDRAKAAGVATARLPIQKYVSLATSTVLAVNHVVQVGG
jgi:tRNA (guanine9-N1)-methyltransferase